ncbi:facilitated trehalose transporter Tret1-like [Diabrotica virgifera virgifera]|uniref:Facilitated trehalose transporter Tret1-like n=1 Tax=Diabrotica virgifera virgifera TaxID=50390 RepID=A0A6P7GMP7_DIAVI|nr:facilitated trehalose transporter Tret1-like [Diabrotica virgifera virgifera]
MDNEESGLFTGTKTQLLAAVFGTLFAISDGMTYGWTAPIIPYLISPESHIKTTKFEAEWLESCLMIGSFLGLPITIYLVDKIGRKKSLLLAAVLSLISWIIIAFAGNMVLLFVARFIFGVTANTSFVAAPIYVAEIADHKIRGFLSSIIYLNMLFGLILVYSVGPYLPFFVAPLIGVTVLFIELLVFPFMPETPYYLLHTNQKDEGKKSLEFFRPGRNIDRELADITKAVARQTTEQGRLLDLFSVKANRKAITIMAILDAGQHLCAISVILMNLHVILEAAGSIYINSSTAAIIFAFFMFVAAYVSSLQVDKYGRRRLLIVSLLTTALCLGALAIYFHLKLLGYDVTGASWLPIVAVMLYALCFKVGMGIVPIVLTAEIFSTKMKAMGMAISDLMYVTGSIVSLQIYQWLTHSYGLHIPFYLFTICSIVICIFTYVYIPETKGKTLEEIQYLLKDEPMPPHKSDSLVNLISNGSKSYSTF